MEHMYSFCSENFSNVVEVYICSLRRKLGSVSKSKLIHTFRGQGYLLGEPPA
jgi:DNA-binding response OmpR family regulator